ncbi:hypothetical protein K470DRAFT_222448 [Piedraia hortae CBS 480.64]|uniref:Uncharacterized protein n=1 Tax=Piedraia hortae CBS 480.64 TaxID=1314780 RepID=A0A6A7BRM1_9PEZI|nr:hypothetical protein K470DRAFT_222448 [Piedraia hortae CBS 480.64]
MLCGPCARQESTREMYSWCRARVYMYLWAYMWAQWYQPGKWGLRAQSSNELAISVPKTTVIICIASSNQGWTWSHTSFWITSSLTRWIVCTIYSKTTRRMPDPAGENVQEGLQGEDGRDRKTLSRIGGN